LSADQFRPAATHAPVTVLVVMADAGQVLLVGKLLLHQSLNQLALLQSKLLQLLSNPERDDEFRVISSGRWFKGVDIQQSLM